MDDGAPAQPPPLFILDSGARRLAEFQADALCHQTHQVFGHIDEIVELRLDLASRGGLGPDDLAEIRDKWSALNPATAYLYGNECTTAPVRGWIEGADGWIQLTWIAGADLSDVRITAEASDPDVSVDYVDAARWATPVHGADLADGEIDSTLIHLTTSTALGQSFTLEITAEGTHTDRTVVNRTDAIHFVVTDRQTGLVPLVDEVLVDSGSDGSANWIQLAYLAPDSGIHDITIAFTSTGPMVPISRPDTGTRQPVPAVDVPLRAGETRAFPFWIDPDRAEPGRYDLAVEVHYLDGADIRRVSTHPLTVNVTGN